MKKHPKPAKFNNKNKRNQSPHQKRNKQHKNIRSQSERNPSNKKIQKKFTPSNKLQKQSQFTPRLTHSEQNKANKSKTKEESLMAKLIIQEELKKSSPNF